MDGWLKQNTAAVVKVGPYISSTDGFTLCVSTGGVTLGATDVRISKAGGDFASKASATTSVFDENGYFDVTLSTADIGTVGRLMLNGVTTAAYLPVWHTYQVLPANVYDSLVTGNDYLDVNAVQLKGGTSSADDMVTLIGKAPSYNYLSGSTSPTGEITASVVGAVTLTTGAEDSLVDKTWDELIANHATTATMGDAVNRVTSGYISANVIRLAGGTSAADNLEKYCDGSTYMPVNAIQVNSATPVDAAAMADAVWDEGLGTHTSTGTAGDAIGRLDEMSTGIASIEAKLPSKSYLTGSSNSDGDIEASQINGSFSGSVGSVAGAVASVTAAVTVSTGSQDLIVDKTWDELLSGHTSTGSMGDAMNRQDEMSTGIVTLQAKLPSKNYLAGTTNADGSLDAAVISGNLVGSVGSVVGSVGSVAGAVASVTAGVTLTSGAEDGIFGFAYESTETFQDYLRLSRSALLGLSSGGGTATAKFVDRAGLKARITATVTTDGDRTNVVVDATT